MAPLDEVRPRRRGFGGGKVSGRWDPGQRVARWAGLLAAIGMLWGPTTAAASALGMLKKGQSVEVSGEWDAKDRAFVATKVENLLERRRPSARGVIEALDRSAATFKLLGRVVQVNDSTLFVTAAGGTFADLEPGMRVEVSAEAGPTGAWNARKVEWDGVKASDKVKGTITEVGPPEGSVQSFQISGLDIRVTQTTEFEADYLRGELLGTLFSDEGDARAPHLRIGPQRLAGYARMTTRRDDGYTLSSAEDETVVGEPAVALQLAGDWAEPFQTMVEARVGSDQSFVENRFDVSNARPELLQAYAVLGARHAKGVMLTVGKQRVRDHREWLFDEYLDAARLYLTLTRPLIIEASYIPSVFPPQGESFATWDDLLLRARFIPDARNEINVYWLMRRDSSPRNREPVYLGLSCSARPTRWLRGWFEGALLRGQDKGRPQEAFAFDVGTTFSTTGRVRPGLTLAYALGSGEEKRPGDPNSQEFRQTGYEDNSGRFGGFSSFNYYGEVLDPELSNLEVMTVAAGIRFGYVASLDVIAHAYRQHRLDDDLRAALVLQDPPDESSRDLGQEIDVVLGVQNIFQCASASYGFGLFEPGRALDATGRVATRHRLSVRVGF